MSHFILLYFFLSILGCFSLGFFCLFCIVFGAQELLFFILCVWVYTIFWQRQKQNSYGGAIALRQRLTVLHGILFLLVRLKYCT